MLLPQLVSYFLNALGNLGAKCVARHEIELGAAQFQPGAPAADAGPVVPALQMAAPATVFFHLFWYLLGVQLMCSPSVSKNRRIMLSMSRPYEDSCTARLELVLVGVNRRFISSITDAGPVLAGLQHRADFLMGHSSAIVARRYS